MYKKILSFLELLTIFILLIAYMYGFEYVALFVKNVLESKQFFEFPAGFIYSGFR